MLSEEMYAEFAEKAIAEFSLEGMEKAKLIQAKLYTKVVDFLQIDEIIKDALGSSSDSTASTISEIVMTFAEEALLSFRGVGLAIAILFFLMAMLDIVTTDRFTLEYFIRFFGKLAISIALIEYAQPIVSACIDFGDGFLNLAFSRISIEGDGLESIMENLYMSFIDNSSGFDGFMQLLSIVFTGVLSGLVAMIAAMIITVVVYIVSFTRLLEMCVRAIFMPVAFGLLADDGWRGAGGRYIRKFIAVCSQGAVLLAIGYGYNAALTALATVIANTGTDNIFTQNPLMGVLCFLGLGFATVSLLFKSIGIVNDIFGA